MLGANTHHSEATGYAVMRERLAVRRNAICGRAREGTIMREKDNLSVTRARDGDKSVIKFRRPRGGGANLRPVMRGGGGGERGGEC